MTHTSAPSAEPTRGAQVEPGTPAPARRRPRKSRSALGPFERPLDKFLTALRLTDIAYRLAPEPPSRGEVVYAKCPVCLEALRVIEKVNGGEIVLQCSSGCTGTDVRAALASKLSERSAFAEAADIAW
jgi:hypothetical protein